MIRLNVINLKGFLETVDHCAGPINVIDESGVTDIHHNALAQTDLLMRHKANKKFLSLQLDIPHPRDYLDIVCFSLGEF